MWVDLEPGDAEVAAWGEARIVIYLFLDLEAPIRKPIPIRSAKVNPDTGARRPLPGSKQVQPSRSS